MKWLLTAVVLIGGGLWWATYNHGSIGRVVGAMARDIRQNFGV
jgi:hypothetical protein